MQHDRLARCENRSKCCFFTIVTNQNCGQRNRVAEVFEDVDTLHFLCNSISKNRTFARIERCNRRLCVCAVRHADREDGRCDQRKDGRFEIHFLSVPVEAGARTGVTTTIFGGFFASAITNSIALVTGIRMRGSALPSGAVTEYF